MHKYLLILLLILAVGCKKGSIDATVTGDKLVLGTGLPGTWELRTSINGNTGMPTTHNPGNGAMLILTADHYQVFSAGNLIKDGSYKIAQQYSTIQRQNITTMVFDGIMGNPLSTFDLNGNTLSISLDAYDAPSSIYERIK